MSGLREIFRRIGMPDAISWPVFWASFVAGTLANYATSTRPAPIWVRLFILVIGQIALWVPPLLARQLLLRNPDRSRPVVVLLSFTVGFLTRALLIGALSGILIAPEEALWFRRFIGALLNIGWVLVLTAYVTTSVRERRRQIARLRQQRAELEIAVERSNELVTQRNEETVSRIRETLVHELQRLDGNDLQGSLATLQHTASAVVRPLSHELANAFPTLDRESIRVAPISAAWSEVLDSAASHRPFRPWATALTLALPLIAAAAVAPPLALWFLLLFFVVAGVLALANLVLGPLLRRRSREIRLATVVIGSLVCGMLTSGIGLALLKVMPGQALIGGQLPTYVSGFLVGLACYTALFSLGVAVVLTFARDRARVAQELIKTSAELERGLVLTRQTQWLQQKALSRALHGPVQAAVTAAAIRLEDSLRDGRAPSASVEEVRAALLDELDVLTVEHGSVASLAEAVARLEATWDGICRIKVEATEEIERILHERSALRACTIDVVSEAVSNSIRHGKASEATILIERLDPEFQMLRVRVESNGDYSPGGSGRGLGSRLLDECTLAWSRVPSERGQTLTADFPIADAPRIEF
jgi:signal transduction histidine kinase